MDKIEKLLALDYNDVDLISGDHSIEAGTFTQATDRIKNNANGQIDESGQSGQIFISWFVEDDFPVEDSKSVRVTVSHRVPLARDRILRIDFIKANM